MIAGVRVSLRRDALRRRVGEVIRLTAARRAMEALAAAESEPGERFPDEMVTPRPRPDGLSRDV